MELTDKVVLVTGGARRVGRAVALRLAQDGAKIAIHYNRSEEDAENTAKDIRARGGDALVFQADLADIEACQSLPTRVVGAYRKLDILVNNASIFEPMRIDDFDLDAWEKHLRINLTAPMLLTCAAAEFLRAARGKVVNFCDVSTARPWPDHLAYMASKGGLDTLTKALARALAPKVTVNGVAPGVAAWPPDYGEERRARLIQNIPLNRAGTPDDMAAAVHYLVTCGDYITGAILPVDGGRSIV